MSTIAQAILDTVIGRLATLFLVGAGNDMAAAHQAATQMLAAHNPATPDELTLAAEIISLQFHTLEALTCASDTELSLNKILRLRGSAVSLSRESHKARRKLDQLQRARRAGNPAQAEAPAEVARPQATPAQTAPTQPATPQSEIDNLPGLIDAARNAILAATQPGENWAKRPTAAPIAPGLEEPGAGYVWMPNAHDAAMQAAAHHTAVS